MITHRRRLADVAEPLAAVRRSFAGLGDKLAAVLWQLPPNLGRDMERLVAFAGALSAWTGVGHVMEFRDPFWFDDKTETILGAHGLANGISDAPKWPLWVAVAAERD